MAVISALILPKIPAISRRTPISFQQHSRPDPPFLLETLIQMTSRNRNRLVAFAAEKGPDNGSSNSNGNRNGNGNGNGGLDDLKKDGRPILNLKWRELLDPDPENILAVGLTGLLAWASVQVLFQLFVISLAILVAALKYSSIAALLLFILITLL